MELLRWLFVIVLLYAVVCFIVWLWRNEADANGFRPRSLVAFIALFGGVSLLFAAWMGGAFESARERCSRLASDAFPLDGESSTEREWNRYFYRCLAENRRHGVEIE